MLNDTPIHDSLIKLFSEIPTDKKGALVGIYDIETKQAKLHIAYRINDTWKVGGQVGWTVNKKPEGYIGIEAVW